MLALTREMCCTQLYNSLAEVYVQSTVLPCEAHKFESCIHGHWVTSLRICTYNGLTTNCKTWYLRQCRRLIYKRVLRYWIPLVQTAQRTRVQIASLVSFCSTGRWKIGHSSVSPMGKQELTIQGSSYWCGGNHTFVATEFALLATRAVQLHALCIMVASYQLRHQETLLQGVKHSSMSHHLYKCFLQSNWPHIGAIMGRARVVKHSQSSSY